MARESTYLTAFGFGVLAGMRSMSAPAFISTYLANQPDRRMGGWLGSTIGSQVGARMFQLMAVGELFGDKLPNIPARTSPGPLFGRFGTGGLSGAAVFRADGEDPLVGAALGAVAGVAGSYGGYYLRLGLMRVLPGLVAGLVEDAIVLGAGILLLRYWHRSPDTSSAH